MRILKGLANLTVLVIKWYADDPLFWYLMTIFYVGLTFVYVWKGDTGGAVLRLLCVFALAYMLKRARANKERKVQNERAQELG